MLSILSILPILAEGEAQQGPPPWMTPVVLGFGLLMVMMFMRTSSKQRRDLQRTLAALKKNDKVVTSGGILGTVTHMKDGEDEVTLKVDDTSNTRIRVLKSSIVKITSGDTIAGDVKP